MPESRQCQQHVHALSVRCGEEDAGGAHTVQHGCCLSQMVILQYHPAYTAAAMSSVNDQSQITALAADGFCKLELLAVQKHLCMSMVEITKAVLLSIMPISAISSSDPGQQRRLEFSRSAWQEAGFNTSEWGS